MSRESFGVGAELGAYLAASGEKEHPVASEQRAATASLPEADMQIAVEQGQLLSFLIKTIGARSVLEIGTFLGYSAMWMASALPRDGKLIACDVSREWTDIARDYWARAGLDDRIELRLGRAGETLRQLQDDGARFDFAFVDADKSGYPAYYEAALKLVRPGGLIVFDNMLQHGRVLDPEPSGVAKLLRELSARIADDDRVDVILLPLGDGMSVVRRR